MRNVIKIRQRDLTDCGAACLASVAAHYKLLLPVARIRQFATTDQRGTNMLGMVKAATKLGFQAKGVKGTLESLPKIPLPAIAHVVVKEHQLHHYVVLYRVSSRQVIYMDPGDGKLHRVALAEFQERWTGVLLLLLPDTSFQPGDEQHSVLSGYPNREKISCILVAWLRFKNSAFRTRSGSGCRLNCRSMCPRRIRWVATGSGCRTGRS